MRKTLAFVVALATALASALPRHVNPDEVAVAAPDPTALSRAYDLLAAVLSAEDYGSSRRLIDLLLNASAPADLAYVLRRFHRELGGVSELLNASRAYLERAKRLILAGRLDDAREVLGEALRALAKVNVTRADLELAAREVERRLRARPAPLLRAVAELLSRHANEAETLLGAGKLRGTELEIDVEPRSAWVGSTVRVWGRLTSLGEPLPGRKVVLSLGGVVVGSVVTDAGGDFAHWLKLPYVYRRSILVGALFLPEAGDASLYRPSSDTAEIELLYEVPRLSVSVSPSTALPGERVRVEVLADRPGLRVTISALSSTRTLAMQDVSAVLWVEVPLSAAEGVHRVLATSEPEGTLGPASAEAFLGVRKLDALVNITAPQIVLAPLPIRATVCVRGLGGAPLNYTLMVSIHGSSLEVSSDQPCVLIELAVPPLSPTGPAQVEALAIPQDPRYRLARETARVTIVNLLLLTPAASLLAPLALLAGARRSPPEAQPPPAAEEQPVRLEELYSARLSSDDPIINGYFGAVRLVERATGVLLKPSHTISEYLALAEPKLGEAAKFFALLSRIAEARIYGGVAAPAVEAGALREQLEKLLGGSA